MRRGKALFSRRLRARRCPQPRSRLPGLKSWAGTRLALSSVLSQMIGRSRPEFRTINCNDDGSLRCPSPHGPQRVLVEVRQRDEAGEERALLEGAHLEQAAGDAVVALVEQEISERINKLRL